MRNTIKQTACALAVLATTSGSVLAAGESIDLKVIGTINPAACTPTLGGGGTVDYGTIDPKTLKKDMFTHLPRKHIEFSLACDAATRVGIVAKTGRGASAVNEDGTLSEVTATNLIAPNVTAIGLGLDSRKNGVGGVAIAVGSNFLADSVEVTSIWTENRQANKWENVSFPASLFSSEAGKLRYVSWSATKSSFKSPTAFTNLTGKLEVQAYINKRTALDLSRPVKLDGLATIELVYL